MPLTFIQSILVTPVTISTRHSITRLVASGQTLKVSDPNCQGTNPGGWISGTGSMSAFNDLDAFGFGNVASSFQCKNPRASESKSFMRAVPQLRYIEARGFQCDGVHRAISRKAPLSAPPSILPIHISDALLFGPSVAHS
ncbi:hypothetical protein AG1IA_08365 [Rhizoctonia solani AG-1 IA]|uniref:Uncharacterized protein n=1 Tax=Thanatephorus cucumeris (strain AG1-IA) TaxID=983506 RepID=L8WI46_THACA|nr:hypothetical protein AG1IA_08365 [Rhizoctonia solani AG-1 IA]